MEKVAIYVRLSVEDEEKKDESESIKNQKKLLIDYANSKNWNIYKIFCDEDFSGLDNDRPEFKNLIKEAEEGKFQIILCKSQSRFTRDIEIAEKYINRLFFIWNIRFISLVDNVDTKNKDGKKARQINGLINEWYCEDLSESVNAVFKTKMKRGEFIGSFAPYGYKKCVDNKNCLEIDEEVAENIKLIFKLYLEGSGIRKIAKQLTKMKILTPTQYKILKGEKFFNPNQSIQNNQDTRYQWSSSTIRNILKNKVYIGNMVQGKTKKISYKSKKIINVNEQNQIVAFGTHKALISLSDFNEVQKRMNGKRFNESKTGINAILSGKIKCGKCGADMQRGSMNREKTGFYYRCSRKYKSYNQKCNNCGILNTDIECIIFDKIKSLAQNYASEFLVENNKKEKIDFQECELRIQNYENQIADLYNDYKDGLLEKSEFLVIKKKIADKKKLEELKLNKNINSQDNNKFFRLIYDKKLSVTLLNEFIEEIIVGELTGNERQIIIKWKI